ncbi:MAG TPA: acetylornithine deacetylase [Acidobacteriaceae bacterium]|nr:acetylornithine deacetylase [Acidobacteriaceae bacterium]
MVNPADVLRDLVGIPSASAMSNVPVIAYAERLLKRCGWHTRRVGYVDAGGIEKANLIAIPEQHAGGLPQVELAFVCHTDTVPYRDEWADALNLKETGGVLHGCGACDVKGSLACLLAAIAETDAKALKRPVALVLTADEEVGCVGTTRLLAEDAVRPRFAVVCEPTSLRPATAGKGYALAQVRVTGREAHSAFPEKGISAVFAAAEMLRAIEAWGSDDAGPRDALFDPPRTTYNVGLVQGGTAKNIIPGECAMTVEWRPVPGEDAAEGGRRLDALAREVEERNGGCEITVEVLRAEAGFARRPEAKLGPRLVQMLGRPECGVSFGSEATRFAQVAEEIVVIGPGDMHTAHSDRECVPTRELAEWIEVVKKLLKASWD